MALSEAASWLQQALLDLSRDKASGVQLEPDVLSSLVSYCELASPVDASEYIKVHELFAGSTLWEQWLLQ